MRLGSSQPSPTCVQSIAPPIACEATSLEPPVKIAPPAASQDAPSSSRSAHHHRHLESREPRAPREPRQGPQHTHTGTTQTLPHPTPRPPPPAPAPAPARRQTNHGTDRGGNPHRATASSSLLSSRPPEKIEQPEQIELAAYPRPADAAAAQRYHDAVRQREHAYDLRRAEKRRWLEEQDEMKFSHSLQFNAVPDWSSHYIAYSNLKKLYVPRARMRVPPPLPARAH